MSQQQEQEQEQAALGEVCQRCGGAGWLHLPTEIGALQYRCPACEGDGRVVVATFQHGSIVISAAVPARFHPEHRAAALGTRPA
jgi:DnaJ-class molecular chaperone